MIGTSVSASTTPRTPPKWSMWECVKMTAVTGRSPRCSRYSARPAAATSDEIGRVDDDDAGVALDESHVRDVQAADLVDPLGHLEQTLDGGQLALPPQTRVHRLRALTSRRPLERVRVIDHAPVGAGDHAWLQPRDQPPLGVVEIGTVSEISGQGEILHRTDRAGIRASHTSGAGGTGSGIRQGALSCRSCAADAPIGRKPDSDRDRVASPFKAAHRAEARSGMSCLRHRMAGRLVERCLGCGALLASPG